jgi:hypothetical protein
MDHGDASPTCCLWCAALDGVYIFYREYYVPRQTISYHRQAISDLSAGESYAANYADPQIFKKTAQKDGGFWSVAEEYLDTSGPIKAPPLHWTPADNNEFATRNRINELLTRQPHFIHPVTKERNSIGLYFIKRTDSYPFGTFEAPRQLNAQRRKVLGQVNGSTQYSDDRDDSVVDHAYDCIRYKVAMHANPAGIRQIRPPRMSFAFYHSLRNRQSASVANSI